MILRTALLVLALSPAIAMAAGSGSGTPPTTTPTQQCATGKIWDKKTKSCIQAESQLLDDATRYAAVRELAYAGRPMAAQQVLATMSDQSADHVLTYWGFTSRQLGQKKAAMGFYKRTLAKNPNNLLARSYMGQFFVLEGKLPAAHKQLFSIRARGGTGTWAETALAQAIHTGVVHSY